MTTFAKKALDANLSRPLIDQKDVETLVAALASLVISQAMVTLLDRQVISGLDRHPGLRNGLTVEERKVLALVSRFSLSSGLRDFGGEIHDLLFHCTLPLQGWLAIPELIDSGYGPIVLIDPDYGIPTPEAQELASKFTSVNAHLEERLFASLKDALNKYPSASANSYYTAIREFVVRNPVSNTTNLFEAGKHLPGALWMAIQQEFYESVPHPLAEGGGITLCLHCNSMMQRLPGKGHMLRCLTRSCYIKNPPTPGSNVPIQEAKRVKRSIHQYWVEPGVDEVFLFDLLKKEGLPAELYPSQDRVDISIDNVGIDLKSYVSPEILGTKFKKSLGGLAHFTNKWIVIPDALVTITPNYLDRLSRSMGENAAQVQLFSVSEAYRQAQSLPGALHA